MMGGMTRRTWPRHPSARFTTWSEEFIAWAKEWMGRDDFRIRDQEYEVQNSRLGEGRARRIDERHKAHGGIDEAYTLTDLEWLAHTEASLTKEMISLWDIYAEAVLEAASEGGVEATAEVLRADEQWIRDLARKGQPVSPFDKALAWAKEETGGLSTNPLMRSEQVWELREASGRARLRVEHLRDQLILELAGDGCPPARLAKALGWSYARLRKRLDALEMLRMDQEQRVRQGDVRGVIDLESRRAER